MSVPAASISPSLDRIHTIAVLLGDYPEIDAFREILNSHFLDGPSSLDEWHSLWLKTSERAARRSQLQTSMPSLKQLPKHLHWYEEELKVRPIYKRNLASIMQNIWIVPINRLLTVQWYADITYIESLEAEAQRFKGSPAASEEVLDFVFRDPPQWTLPKCDAGSIVLPPATQNLRLQLSSVRRTSHPFGESASAYETTLYLEPGANYLQVAQVGQRLIVINGVHRICALARVGWKSIPCLLRKAQNLAEVGFMSGAPGRLPDQRVLRDHTPPAVLDLLNESYAPRFRQRHYDEVRVAAQRIPIIKQP